MKKLIVAIAIGLMPNLLHSMEAEYIKPYGQETSLQGFARKLSVATCFVTGGYLAYKGIQEGNVQKTLSGLGLTSVGTLLLKTTDFSFSKEQRELGENLAIYEKLVTYNEVSKFPRAYVSRINNFSSFMESIREKLSIEQGIAINRASEDYDLYMRARTTIGMRALYAMVGLCGFKPWYAKTELAQNLREFKEYPTAKSYVWVSFDKNLLKLKELFLKDIFRFADNGCEKKSYVYLVKKLSLRNDQIDALDRLIQKGFDIRDSDLKSRVLPEEKVKAEITILNSILEQTIIQDKKDENGEVITFNSDIIEQINSGLSEEKKIKSCVCKNRDSIEWFKNIIKEYRWHPEYREKVEKELRKYNITLNTIQLKSGTELLWQKLWQQDNDAWYQVIRDGINTRIITVM